MPGDLFKKLLDLASEQDRKELQLVHYGRIKTMQAYNANPGKDAKGDMDAARLAFDETMDRMQGRYLPDDGQPVESEVFVNRKQALNWLQAQGYKVGQDKFYKDCKAGCPLVYKNGTVSKYQVMQYGQQLDVQTRGSGLTPESMGSVENDARKLKAEADIAEMKAERMRREEDKYWLHADEAWATMAALIGTLRDAIRHQLHEGAREVIYLAGGDQDRSHEVFEGVDQLVSQAFNEVAGNEVNVEFEREFG